MTDIFPHIKNEHIELKINDSREYFLRTSLEINSTLISNIFSDKFSQVTFYISPKDKIFRITTKNIDIGENINNLDAVIKGEELTISFNYKYIIDCFQSIDSDSVTLLLSDMNRAMIIKGTNDKSFLYLVMPMNK
jgi:DNA polymerase-3 subunit beta